jgi:hypothetical protein
MKLTTRRRLHRRDFIQWIGGAALALPALELFELQAHAQTATKQSKFIVFIYTNDGMNVNPVNGDFTYSFFPTNNDLSTSRTLSSLVPYKDKVLLLGPQFTAGLPTTDTGLTYNMKPAQHRANICLTGSQVVFPIFTPQSSVTNKGDGPSIDHVIGKAMKTMYNTPLSNLDVGVHPIGTDTPSEINFDDMGNPKTRISDVNTLLSTLFGSVMSTPGSPSATADLHKLNAITNFLNSRFADLRPHLSPYDQQVIDHHLSSLQAYESQQSQLLTMQSMPGGGCQPPNSSMVPTDPNSIATGADTQFLMPFFYSSMAVAFSCGMTRVASMTCCFPGGGGEGGARMPWLNVPGIGSFTDAQHGVSHHAFDPIKLQKYAAMNAWWVSQVKFLMDQLAAIPAAGGTLLDQTTIYFFNRHGEGNAHTNFGLPNMILGGTGGYFKMGQILSLPKTSPTEVLISLANSMGVQVPTFGTGAYVATSPMSGIAA